MISRTLKRFYKPIVVERGILLAKRYALPNFFSDYLLKALADPDLHIMGVGGGAGHPEPEIRAGPRLKKNIFSALRASFWSKNKVGWGAEPGPRVPPLDPPLQGFFTHIKTESTRKLSNLNFHWTETLYQNNLKNIAFFFTFFRG